MKDKHTKPKAAGGKTDKSHTQQSAANNSQADHSKGTLPTDQLGNFVNEETKLRIKKLSFETGSGRFLEWFKTVGGIIVALGVIGTLALTIYQQRQNRLSRDDDRFDRAVSRVGSSQIAERLTGLSGLQQFLQSGDIEHTRSALQYLVNAVTIEHDPNVRSAILDTFDSLQSLSLPRETLNAALESARDRNRAVFNRIKSLPWSSTKEKPVFDPDVPELAINPISKEDKDELLATASAMASLVRAGAKVDDLSGIFCLKCDFSSARRKVDLSGVNFDLAVLRLAKFFGVNVDKASFHNADLIAADFTNASLRDATLTADVPIVPWTLQAAYATRDLMNVRGTTFACADLTRADFSGTTIFGFIRNDPIFGGYKDDEFYAANLDGANFVGSQVFVAVPQSDYTPQSTNDPAPQLGQLSPFDAQTFGSGPSDPINYVNQKYLVSTFTLSGNTGISVPLDSAYRRSLLKLLSSFGFAKHFTAAKVPNAISLFVGQNLRVLDKPITSYDCKGGKSFDITQMFNSHDVGPKDTQP